MQVHHGEQENAHNLFRFQYHYQGIKASEVENLEVAKTLFDKAGEYWRQAIKLAPNNYIEAQNWLKTTGRIAENSL